MMLNTDRVTGAALAIFALLVLWESRALPFGSLRTPGPAYVPVVLALVLLVLGVLIAATGAGAPRLDAVGWGEAPRALVILAVCAAVALGLERLGYRATMLAALVVLVWVVERRSLPVALAFAAFMAFGSFHLFNTVLRVPLPRGPFGL